MKSEAKEVRHESRTDVDLGHVRQTKRATVFEEKSHENHVILSDISVTQSELGVS